MRLARSQIESVQHVGFGLIHDGDELGRLGPFLIGHAAPRGAGGFGRLLRESGGDEGGDYAAARPSGMGKDVPHEVRPAALPAGT
jgi:hypothetical protein